MKHPPVCFTVGPSTKDKDSLQAQMRAAMRTAGYYGRLVLTTWTVVGVQRDTDVTYYPTKEEATQPTAEALKNILTNVM